MSAPAPMEPFRLPGPADGWTREREVTLECAALDDRYPSRADASLAALGEIYRLRLLADGPARSPRAADVIDDGVEVWMVRDGLDVTRDATSVIHGATYRVGPHEVSESTLRSLCDAVTAALAGGAR